MRNDKATEQAKRSAASILHSLICDVLAHDPPNGSQIDDELRNLAEEFRKRSGI